MRNKIKHRIGRDQESFSRPALERRQRTRPRVGDGTPTGGRVLAEALLTEVGKTMVQLGRFML
jgi:hypothetical protein